MPAVSLRAGVVAQLAPKLLVPDPDNPRRAFDEKAQAALVESVKARGVLIPLVVRKGEKGSFIVVHGHRRLAAAKAAKRKTVPVILDDQDDAAERRLDQVAVNNLHEHLSTMDTARMLRKLRDEQKLTPNDLAARMDKAGTPMSLKEIEASIALTDLPDWAAGMVDAQQLEPAAAAVVLQGSRDRAIAGKLQAKVKEAMGWRGRVSKADADRALAGAYHAVGIDLTATWGYSEKEKAALPHFNWKTRCKGCEHLRALAGDAYCMSQKLFRQHNAEAIEAGLGIGGERPQKAEKPDPAKLTPKQKAKLENEREEKREQTSARRADLYLENWLRGRVSVELATFPKVAASLVLWHAANRPHMGGNAYDGGGNWRERAEVENRLQLACKVRRGRLDLFLDHEPDPEEQVAIAREVLPLMSREQIRTVAHFVEISIVDDWKADAAYVALRSREQLEQWLAKFGLDATGKVSELRQRLLDHPHTLQYSAELPHMAALSEAYLAEIVDEVVADEEWKGALEELEEKHGDGEDTDVEQED